MTSDIAVPITGQQAMTELGARAHHTGFAPDQVRALVARIQEMAATTTLGAMPDILDNLAAITMGKFVDLAARVQGLRGMGPYVRREDVLLLIQAIATAQPPLK